MILRLIPAMLLGLGVSAGLYFMMNAMLQHHFDLTERDPLTQVDFVRLKHEETPPETIIRELPQPPDSEATATPPTPTESAIVPSSPNQAASPPAFDMPKLALPVGGGTIAAPVTGATNWSSLDLPAPDSGATPKEGMPTAPDTLGSQLTPIVRIPPTYPLEARRKKIEGWVRMELTVLEDGSVTDIKVKGAAPTGIFEQAALAAIAQWKFRPAMENGKAVRRRAGQTLKFELNQ